MPTTTTRAPRTPRKKPGTAVERSKSGVALTVPELIEQGQQALKKIIELEAAPAGQYEALADTLIEMRTRFMSPGRDFPDWRGRSQDYRTAAAAVYASANIPPDAEGSIQARIRYVINNRLRLAAPAKQLEALGYKKKNQAESAKERRDSKKGKQPLDTEGPTLTAPGNSPIETRAQAYRALRDVLLGPVWDLPIPDPETDEAGYVECMRELVDATLVLEQLWALQERRRSVRRNTIQLGATYAATATKQPETREELADIRAQASMEARVLSAPPPEAVSDAALTG